MRVGLGLLAAGLVLLGVPQEASAAGGSAYVTNYFDARVSQFDVGAGGALGAKTPMAVVAGNLPRGVAVSPDGRSVYVTNYGGGDVSQYDVGAGGALSAKTPAAVAAGSLPVGVAVSPDGRSVYVINSGGGSVSQFDVGAGGALSAKTPTAVAAGSSPFGVAVTPDGRSVYVTNEGSGFISGNVSQYDVGAGGALSAKTPTTVATGTAPQGVAVSPDGRSAYVTNQDGVSQFDVGAGGALSAKTPTTVATGSGPYGVAVTPDGRSAYVTNVGGGDVSQYDVGAGGALSAKTPATVFAYTQPRGVAVSPDQGPVAAFSVAAGAAGSPTRFDGSSSSDSDGSVVRYDWDFGDGSSAPNAGPMPSHTYATPGAYTATLTVTDDAGCSSARVFTGQTVSCNGTAAARNSRTVGVPPMSSTPLGMPGGFDTTTPSVSGYRLSNNPFLVASAKTPRFANATANKKHKKGTTFKYTLSEAATVRMVIAQRRSGRRKGKRCVTPTRKLRHARKCTRSFVRGTLTRVSRQGANSVAFSGRIGSKALRPGSYQATLTAADAARNTSRTKTTLFGIVKR